MRFDWVRLLRNHRVPYVERGANVKRGEVNIKCPFCGSADPSQHMGLNSEKGYWSCWRNREEHSGRRPHRLIMRLLRCSFARACEIVGVGVELTPDDFEAVARKGERLFETEDRSSWFDLVLPKTFLPIRVPSIASNYLTTRGFRRVDLSDLVDQYTLHYDQSGSFRGRLIFPITLDGRLVTWTGRHCGSNPIRYKALPSEESILPTTEILYNYDRVSEDQDCQWVIVVEGPIDALKIDYYGCDVGARAVALMSLQLSEMQQSLLIPLLEQYKIGFLLDSGMNEWRMAQRFADEVSFLGKRAQVLTLPEGIDDPGSMSRYQVRKWVDGLAN